MHHPPEVDGEAFATFRATLERQGLKLSAARRCVAAGVLEGRRHFTAESLYAFLRKKKCPVSRASVYRTLALMERGGLVRRVLYGEGEATYEQQEGREHHDHLVCLACGKVTEFVNPRIEELQDQVCSEHGFVALRHNMQISGTCRRCRGRQEKEARA